MINRTLIIGYGEVGRAHFKVLSLTNKESVFYKDMGEQIYNINGKVKSKEEYDLLIIATQCNPKDMKPFVNMVCGYAEQFEPKYIDILTTTPCGTCEDVQDELGPEVMITKSSVRGMHPNLEKFLIDIPKHIGGISREIVKDFYTKAGIICVLHEKSRAVELFHVLNNFIYGCNVMAADECAKYCREFGVDYMEFLEYRKTNNSGFLKAGFPSKVSPVLYPSGGRIQGHCVTYAPTTIPENKRGLLAQMLCNYNK